MRALRSIVLLAPMLGMLEPVLAQPIRIAGPIDNTQSVALPGTLHPQAQARYDQGPVDPDLQIGYITLMFGPPVGQQATLERLLEEQQDRSSPNYHRWLTPEQFGDRFGLSRSDYSAVVAWIESQGLHVENTARARNWVAFSGSAGQVQNAFHTEIHNYLVNGQSHFSNATELRIPRALTNLTTGIRGLDDFWKSTARVEPQFTTPAGVHQLAPDDWATIYNVAPLYGMGIDGTGQRIAIVGRSDFSPSLLDAFRSTLNLAPAKLEMHLIGPDPGVTNAAGEAALDIEWAGGIARNATVVYVYANNFNDAVQAVVDQNLAPVMSESLAVCEPQTSPANRAVAQQANAQGITWVASSGDSGGAGCDPHGFFNSSGGLVPASGGLAVGVPASYPEVTAIGGTQFNEGSGQYWRSGNNSNGGSAIYYIPEVVWNETGAGGLLASGGGASIYFPKPTWQSAPGVPDDNARDVPDISFSASGNHDPYLVVNANGQRATGGTSAGSPAFAGVLALLNQYVVSKGLQSQPGLGNINPELYRLAGTTSDVFHDITQGDNIVPCAKGSPDCSTGSFGFAAGPGYDLATGLGSVDVVKLVTAWSTGFNATTTAITANPGSITFGDAIQLTATVTGSGDFAPGGIVSFASGRTNLGAAPLIDGVAMATLTLTAPLLPTGNPPITATYSGDSNFNGSSGSTTVAVAPRSPGSAVVITITPNPARQGQAVKVSLTEKNGVGTRITGWTINSTDTFSRFVPDFGTDQLPPQGTLSSFLATVTGLQIPASRVYVFSGVDADGRTWSTQYTLTLVAPQGTPELALSSVPSVVPQDPNADPSCQWSQQLLLQEQSGFSVELTRLTANGADWTGRMQQLFGTTRLPPFGALQAHVCRAASGPPPQTVTFTLDGTDQIGDPVRATVMTTLTDPPANPASFSVSQTSVTLNTSALSSQITGSQPMTVTVFPSNQTTAWLTTSVNSSTAVITASPGRLTPGVYNATLIFQATGARPQVIEVPVVFIVGASSTASIAGVSNAASFQPIAAPGMILSVFGTGLAPSPQLASTLPLPLTMAGVSATINGIPAPLYYVSEKQLNIQIPYETGTGPAVLGVSNNGQAASFIFTVSPSSPGIFTDSAQALVPIATGSHGDTLTLFMTGEGLTSPSLATGATPFFATPLPVLPRPTLPLSVTVNGVAATISFAGIPSGLAGTMQVNFVIPNGVPTGLQHVVVTVGGNPSAAANITVLP